MNNTFKAILVDDELSSHRILHSFIKEYCPEIVVVEMFQSGERALSFLLQNTIDIVFLDISMPNMSGFDIIKNLGKQKPRVVFVSAYEEYSLDAIKVGAFDYLLKPIDISELRKLVFRLQELEINKISIIESEEFYKITIPQNHGFNILDARNIIRIESDNSYSRLFIKDAVSKLVSKNIGEFEKILSNKGFFRVHNKHLVNLKEINEFLSIDGGIVILSNKDEIPISRRKIKEFKSILKSKFE